MGGISEKLAEKGLDSSLITNVAVGVAFAGFIVTGVKMVGNSTLTKLANASQGKKGGK